MRLHDTMYLQAMTTIYFKINDVVTGGIQPLRLQE
jgi:hypothetical protein